MTFFQSGSLYARFADWHDLLFRSAADAAAGGNQNDDDLKDKEPGDRATLRHCWLVDHMLLVGET